MSRDIDAILVGEVRCINCGRTLGELVRDSASGRLGLRPAQHQQELLVRVVEGRILRCSRCQGRAFVEAPDAAIDKPAARTSVAALRGAA
jgi:hypothetical protein